MRIGFIDLSAAIFFLIALVLPSPSPALRPLYFKETAPLTPQIAVAQSAVGRDPKDGAAAARLTDLLVAAHQTDWAIRAGALGATGGSPTAWMASVSVSAAYMDRRDIASAYDWATKAFAACEASTACTDDDHTRLEMYTRALRSVKDSGIDMKTSAKGLDAAVERAVPLIQLGKTR